MFTHFSHYLTTLTGLYSLAEFIFDMKIHLSKLYEIFVSKHKAISPNNAKEIAIAYFYIQ